MHFLVAIWFIVDQCILMAFKTFNGSSSWILSSLVYLESKSLLSRNNKILKIVKNYAFSFPLSISFSSLSVCIFLHLWNESMLRREPIKREFNKWEKKTTPCKKIQRQNVRWSKQANTKNNAVSNTRRTKHKYQNDSIHV